MWYIILTFEIIFFAFFFIQNWSKYCLWHSKYYCDIRIGNNHRFNFVKPYFDYELRWNIELCHLKSYFCFFFCIQDWAKICILTFKIIFWCCIWCCIWDQISFFTFRIIFLHSKYRILLFYIQNTILASQMGLNIKFCQNIILYSKLDQISPLRSNFYFDIQFWTFLFKILFWHSIWALYRLLRLNFYFDIRNWAK